MELTKFLLCLSFIILFFIKYRWINSLYKKAYFDELTSAKNKIKFKQDIENLNFENTVGLGMFLNLDNFKRINDTYGQDIGDFVLKKVASRLQKIFKKENVYRISGDEFFILHKNISKGQIHSKASKVLKRIQKPVNIYGRSIDIYTSIGICPINESIQNTSDLLHRTDVAMHNVKNNGKRNFAIADDEMIREFDMYKQLEKDFIYSLEKKLIFPYFQPKIELETERVVGVEALARWYHLKEGFISPSVFVDMAEKNDLIYKLDFLIAESSIIVLKDWIEEGVVDNNFKLSFNISVKTFELVNVYKYIDKLLKKHSVSGRNIQIEITESIFTNNIQKVIYEIELLRKMHGISIALDDFTAGHASLKKLGDLGIDTLKFDRGLLQIIKDDAVKGEKIYNTLINLSNDMGYISIAEGVEDIREKEFLKTKGVKFAQGFFFGKPMPEEVFIKFLNSRMS